MIKAARRWHALLAAAIITVSIGRIACSYDELSQTADEPNHLATGLEWYERGTYRMHAENPPLARMAIALGPVLAGWELPARGNAWRRGTDLLYDGDYRDNLALARVGVLPFFVLAAVMVWLLARRFAGPLGALLSVVLFCTVPPVVGHFGLATTDAPLVATLLFAIYALWRWLFAPTLKNAALVGLGFGLALATKLSTLVFFPAAVVAMVPLCWLERRARAREKDGGENADDKGRAEARKLAIAARWLAGVALAIAVAFFTIWACYRFDVGRPIDEPGARRRLAVCVEKHDSALRHVLRFAADKTVPAPALVHGAIWLCAHDAAGHPSYLAGETDRHGHDWFYPVAIAFKTPLPLLLLALVGIAWSLVLAIRRRQFAPAIPGAIAILLLRSVATAEINIGLRHVLVVYPFLAMAAGVACAQAWALRKRGALFGRGLVLALCGWQAFVHVASHPDEIAYFNPLAGEEPGALLVDSDLDWGQDLLALEAYFRDRPVTELHIAYFGTARVCEHDLPPLAWLAPHEPTTGWIAISEMYFRGLRNRHYRDPCNPRSAYRVYRDRRRAYAWLRQYEPVARAGASIRIYHIE